MNDSAPKSQRAQVEATLQRQNSYLSALHETTLALLNRLDLPSLLDTIVAQATALTGIPRGYLYLVDETTSTLTLAAQPKQNSFWVSVLSNSAGARCSIPTGRRAMKMARRFRVRRTRLLRPYGVASPKPMWSWECGICEFEIAVLSSA